MADEEVGPVGVRLADGMTKKIIETVDGFPASSDEEKAGIAERVATDLLDYANKKRGN